MTFKDKLIKDAPLGAQSWFRCGGTADYLFRPDSVKDLQEFLKEAQNDSHLFPLPSSLSIIGGLANTIIRDGGIRGLTIQLDKAMAGIKVLNDTDIYAEAGALNGSVAAAAVKAGIGGLEFLSGIPGKIGGALAMNAGAYGREMKDVLLEAQGLDFEGNIKHFKPSPFSPELPSGSVSLSLKGEGDFSYAAPAKLEKSGEGIQSLSMTYRHTDLPEGTILTSCILRGVKEDYQTVKDRMTEIKARRNDTQPIREKTGGSTFANPSEEELIRAGLEPGLRAWQIVEKVGGRGLQIGGAQMSEKHCNFMVNTGTATASDLEALGNELIRRAGEDLGLTLHWEIKRVGEL